MMKNKYNLKYLTLLIIVFFLCLKVSAQIEKKPVSYPCNLVFTKPTTVEEVMEQMYLHYKVKTDFQLYVELERGDTINKEDLQMWLPSFEQIEGILKTTYPEESIIDCKDGNTYNYKNLSFNIIDYTWLSKGNKELSNFFKFLKWIEKSSLDEIEKNYIKSYLNELLLDLATIEAVSRIPCYSENTSIDRQDFEEYFELINWYILYRKELLVDLSNSKSPIPKGHNILEVIFENQDKNDDFVFIKYRREAFVGSYQRTFLHGMALNFSHTFDKKIKVLKDLQESLEKRNIDRVRCANISFMRGMFDLFFESDVLYYNDGLIEPAGYYDEDVIIDE